MVPRTSFSTCSLSELRLSNMVITTPWMERRGLSVVRICSMVCSSWLRPSSAKNSHCSGTSTASAATRALMVSRFSEGGQSIRT